MKTPTPTPTPFHKPLEYLPEGVRFADMTRTQKCVYVTKVIISIATFGFAFPHI
jgi:hypothetical protein